MRAHQFINEAPVKPYQSEELSIQSAIDTITQHCSQALGMVYRDIPLWRGMNNHSEKILTLWPETGQRKSQNTSNHYTALMAASPHMRGFPRRDKSIICSASQAVAKGYGWSSYYAIIPYDHVEIGVCPDRDFWDCRVTIPELHRSFVMNDFNDWLYGDLGLPETIAGMKAVLANEKSGASTKILRYITPDAPTITPKTFLKYLIDAMDPVKLKLSLLSIPEYIADHPGSNECWVGGPCVAIHHELWPEVVNGVRNASK